jgi:lipid-A-disaccharide synthase
MRSQFIGLANILAGEEVCREITQNECKPKYIFPEALRILTDSKLNTKIRNKLRETKDRELGTTNGAKKAAKEIQNFLKNLIIS